MLRGLSGAHDDQAQAAAPKTSSFLAPVVQSGPGRKSKAWGRKSKRERKEIQSLFQSRDPSLFKDLRRPLQRL
jgi:hypothetical protein